MSHMSFTLNPVVTRHAVSELRAAVGWEPFESEEQHRWDGYWATLGGFDEQGRLMAWCALLSDGHQHGILLDVMVHPQRQKQGIGRALVAEAIGYFRAQGIGLIHVDFLPEQALFYERCGFRIGLGGIYHL
jgi:GNAT superfamily N-acetyltransferase